MSLTDYVIDLGLIAVVFLQIRGRRLTTRSLLVPVGIVTWAAVNYLHGIPTGGNDLVLILGSTAVGALLGGLCAVFTQVTPNADGVPLAKAGWLAATFWVLGVGARFAFQFYATHGGAAAIGRFSVAHGITSSTAWVAALLLMAIAEVLLRTGILGWRAHTLGSSRSPAPRPVSDGQSSMMVGGGPGI
jgi:hypothetical protein